MGRSTPWFKTLRDAIKREHGIGWSVREISGKVQLTRRYEDQSRSAVVLDIPWNSESITHVLAVLRDLRDRMEQHQMGLKEAYEYARKPKEDPIKGIDWDLLIARFKKFKIQETGDVKQSTFESSYQPIMIQIRKVTSVKPYPRDSKALLSALRDEYGGQPGSRSRQLRIQYTCQLLRFAVKDLGVSNRWSPPDDLLPFIGKPASGIGLGSATPIKDEYLEQIFEDIPDERWLDAVRLLAFFGLRPVELKYLSLSNDGCKLHVAYRKRTTKGTTSPGDVPGLDPFGMKGQSALLLEKLSAGKLILPPLGSADADVAQSVRQYLNRRSAWSQLKQLIASQGGRLSAYSFRHGYALRAHEMYGLTPRTTASMMRHTPQTHLQHYGQWTDGATIDQALEKAMTALVGVP